MITLTFIREYPQKVAEACRQKNVDVDIDALLMLDTERAAVQQDIEKLRTRRNELSKMTAGSKPTQEIITQGTALKEELKEREATYDEIDSQLQELLRRLPNIPSSDTPVGADEADNVVVKTVGAPPKFSFTPRPHWELGEQLGLIDSERAAKVSGSRFAYLTGELVLLQFALIQHALSVLTHEETLHHISTAHGLTVPTKPFLPVIPPALVKEDVLDRMARLEPREDRYATTEDALYLNGSAEHTLGPLHMDELLPQSELPKRYVGYSTAFRREAGSYGKDVRGILRMHQFDKLEMETFTTPETSVAEQDFLVAIQEYLMQSLQLPYQVVQVCTGDMGKPDARQIDIETWMPGQNTYRETHSADLMTDYQSRRLNTRYKNEAGDTTYVHMNDATVFAIGRMLIAIMENYQQADGSILVPDVLQPLVGFTKITRP